MSHLHDERNSPELDALLKAHHMATETHSQLSDAFRLGYWSAQAEIARLQAEVERLNTVAEFWKGTVSTANHQRDAANNRQATAHNDALEDAAMVANDHDRHDIEEAIRALKTTNN